MQAMFCEKYVLPGMDDICVSALEKSTILPEVAPASSTTASLAVLQEAPSKQRMPSLALFHPCT